MWCLTLEREKCGTLFSFRLNFGSSIQNIENKKTKQKDDQMAMDEKINFFDEKKHAFCFVIQWKKISNKLVM